MSRVDISNLTTAPGSKIGTWSLGSTNSHGTTLSFKHLHATISSASMSNAAKIKVNNSATIRSSSWELEGSTLDFAKLDLRPETPAGKLSLSMRDHNPHGGGNYWSVFKLQGAFEG